MSEKELDKVEVTEVPEPTDDSVPDGTQIPTGDDMPEEIGDAGVEGAEYDMDVFAEGDD